MTPLKSRWVHTALGLTLVALLGIPAIAAWEDDLATGVEQYENREFDKAETTLRAFLKERPDNTRIANSTRRRQRYERSSRNGRTIRTRIFIWAER